MVKVSDISLVDGNNYQGKFSFYDRSGKHKTTLYWECENPGQKNPKLYFFTRNKDAVGRDLILGISSIAEFKASILSGKENDEFHIELYKHRKMIYAYIAKYIRDERKDLAIKSIRSNLDIEFLNPVEFIETIT